jgi:hypothetical protein
MLDVGSMSQTAKHTAVLMEYAQQMHQSLPELQQQLQMDHGPPRSPCCTPTFWVLVKVPAASASVAQPDAGTTQAIKTFLQPR